MRGLNAALRTKHSNSSGNRSSNGGGGGGGGGGAHDNGLPHDGFFKLLVDAAHCGDSGLTIAENEAMIAQIGAARELSVFHASAKTTRGCLSTDDGWVGAMLAAVARTGELKHAFVEVFHHQDPALQGLRELDDGFGMDTRCGGGAGAGDRSYRDVVQDGLVDVERRLRSLEARGIL